jgi:transcriptional regulator with XRE-family HTH domain
MRKIKGLDLKAIGQRMKVIRKNLGYKQREFAAELTISAATLSDIESGKGKPRHDAIYNLAKKYNVNIYYLLHGKGEMFMSNIIERSIVPETYGGHTEFLLKFLKYFKESSIVRHEMMRFFRTYMIEKEATIEKDILWTKREKEEKEKEKRGTVKKPK